jgi:hypothetical protein
VLLTMIILVSLRLELKTLHPTDEPTSSQSVAANFALADIPMETCPPTKSRGSRIFPLVSVKDFRPPRTSAR